MQWTVMVLSGWMFAQLPATESPATVPPATVPQGPRYQAGEPTLAPPRHRHGAPPGETPPATTTPSVTTPSAAPPTTATAPSTTAAPPYTPPTTATVEPAAPTPPAMPAPLRSQPSVDPRAAAPADRTPSASGTSSAQATEWAESLFVIRTQPTIAGRPVTLVEALSHTPDRTQQAVVAKAYWKLAAAIATWYAVDDDTRRLEQLALPTVLPGQPAAQGAGPLEWETVVAGARARAAEAQVKLVAAQFELAERAHLSGELPLTADRPLVGAYNTFYAQIFPSGRAAPPEARLLDRTLPLRRETLELEAAAARAAQDAAESFADAPMRDWDQVAAAGAVLESLVVRQQAFIAAVHQYNDEIAAYALPLASQGMPPAAIAGMLVKAPLGGVDAPRAAVAVPSTFEAGPGGSPTAFNQPLPAAAQPAMPSTQQPFGAGTSAPRYGEPTLAPSRDMPREIPSRRGVPGAPPPAAASPGFKPTPDAGVGIAPDGTFVARREAMVQLGSIEHVGLYSALVELSPPKRAQELANLLHWDRGAEPMGQPTTLVEALAAGQADRHGVLAMYWEARRQAARVQCAQQTVEQLEALSSTVLDQRGEPSGPLDMLKLREAKLAAEAATAAAKAEFIEAQWTLALRMQRSFDVAWPMPTTAPHGGGYRLELASSVLPQPQQRLSRTIPERHASLQERDFVGVGRYRTRRG